MRVPIYIENNIEEGDMNYPFIHCSKQGAEEGTGTTEKPLPKAIAELGIPDLKDREIIHLTYNSGPGLMLHLNERNN